MGNEPEDVLLSVHTHVWDTTASDTSVVAFQHRGPVICYDHIVIQTPWLTLSLPAECGAQAYKKHCNEVSSLWQQPITNKLGVFEWILMFLHKCKRSRYIIRDQEMGAVKSVVLWQMGDMRAGRASRHWRESLCRATSLWTFGVCPALHSTGRDKDRTIDRNYKRGSYLWEFPSLNDCNTTIKPSVTQEQWKIPVWIKFYDSTVQISLEFLMDYTVWISLVLLWNSSYQSSPEESFRWT